MVTLNRVRKSCTSYSDCNLINSPMVDGVPKLRNSLKNGASPASLVQAVLGTFLP